MSERRGEREEERERMRVGWRGRGRVEGGRGADEA